MRYLVTAVMIVLILRFFPRGLAGIPAFVGHHLSRRGKPALAGPIEPCS